MAVKNIIQFDTEKLRLNLLGNIKRLSLKDKPEEYQKKYLRLMNYYLEEYIDSFEKVEGLGAENIYLIVQNDFLTKFTELLKKNDSLRGSLDLSKIKL